MEKDNIITEESEFKKNLVRIIKGSLFAIITSAILLLFFAVLLCYTSLSENTMLPVILVVTGISILIGSMVSTRKIRKNGILNGGMVGFIYIIILYLISSLFLAGFSLTFNSFIMVIVGVVTGMICFRAFLPAGSYRTLHRRVSFLHIIDQFCIHIVGTG